MKMKKFINNPDDLRQELLEGLAMVYDDVVKLGEGGLIVNKKLDDADRVTVVSIGGTGHEPAISGFVGEGILDVSVPGDIFAAPGPQLTFEGLKLADKGKGVLFVVLNHAGDLMTGSMAMKMADKAGMKVKQLVTQEDIANAPRSNADDRRGLCGCIPVYKVAGAAAARGYDLDKVYDVAARLADNMATISVAARTATHPATGDSFGELSEDEMEVGMGQHGEGGGGRMKMKSADETAQLMADALVKDLELKSGEKVMLFINGSGATTAMEMYILYRATIKYLAEKGIQVVTGLADELLTVQEQAGFQMFMARMDDELLELWNDPCRSPHLTK